MREYCTQRHDEPHKSEFVSMRVSNFRHLTIGMLLAVTGCQQSATDGTMSLTSPRNGGTSPHGLSPDRNIETISVTGPTPLNPQIGSSVYICSPSGFGQQSQCFLRN